MSKKNFEDEDYEEDLNESGDESFNDDEEYDDDESDDINLDDDDNLDLIIEIDEDDLSLIDDVKSNTEDKIDEEDDIVLSKHKLEGKHSLKYDSIFKGKKEVTNDEELFESVGAYFKETIEVDKSSNYYVESIDNEGYIRAKLLKEKVYEVLSQHTEINFLNNRRKPSRIDFNEYYSLLRIKLVDESFTNVEIFNELAVYFSDNLFNMFKLLDKKWRNLIIFELQEHIGKNKNSKEITNRNIYVGTEIEFEWFDEISNEGKLITGVVIETDYPNSIFIVDSYEDIYDVELLMITKILNNSKFKYNLNKLNNIDFL
jgi:hypothetical protein